MFVSLIGSVAAILTTFCQLPQAIQVTKTKHTKDISLPTYTTLGIGVFLWFIYGLYISDMNLIFANAITFILVAYIWIMKIKYG
jgi:MtN3 and saliva related transmembrane protein